MRCIETVNIESSVKKMLGINYNMRCIETYIVILNPMNLMEINYNMRCIETTVCSFYIEPNYR